MGIAELRRRRVASVLAGYSIVTCLELRSALAKSPLPPATAFVPLCEEALLGWSEGNVTPSKRLLREEHEAWQACVFVCNDHGQVLEEWLDRAQERLQAPTPRGKLTVLHIDAHNDLNVPDDNLDFGLNPEMWFSDAGARRELAEAADLVNFQLMAVWGGLVDQIIWLQHGSHKPRHDKTQLLLDRAIGSFTEAIPQELENCMAASCDPVAEDLVQEKDMLARSYLVHEVPEGSLQAPRIVDQVIDCMKPQPYILDIDLDFFVNEGSPGLPPWLRDQTQHRLCLGYTPEPCQSWTDPKCEFWSVVQAQLDHTSMKFACQEEFAALSQIAPLQLEQLQAQLHFPEMLFFAEHWEQHKEKRQQDHQVAEGRLHIDPMSVLLEQQHVLKQPSFRAQMERLESFLVAVDTAMGPPVLVTIARSLDAYTPAWQVPPLESAVLSSIDKLWPGRWDGGAGDGPCVKYAAGTSSLSAFEVATQTFS